MSKDNPPAQPAQVQGWQMPKPMAVDGMYGKDHMYSEGWNDALLEVVELNAAAPQPSDDVAKDALIAKLTTGLSEAKYRIEQGRVWNGMGWTLTGLHPHHQQQAIDVIDAAMAGGGE